MQNRDLIIIGAGPAGMGAALSARKNGINDILIIERGSKAGGILPQCIHNGFGLHRFKEELTGPEYAERFLKQVLDEGIEIQLNTMVIDMAGDKIITAVSKQHGATQIKAKAIILAMGCRERTRGALNIPGSRPAGVLTAGAAQRFVNIEGYMPGKEIVILGSGDIGLIMARRLTLEGANVKAVCEIKPKSSGLQRNISQCLNDFNIPLLLSHTVCEIHGAERVEGVTIAKVDENLKPIGSTRQYMECDTLLLSVGLIPENELSQLAGVELAENGGAKTNKYMQTNVDGIFACGNVAHVHDLVDFATEESCEAGKNAAKYILNQEITGNGYVIEEKEEEPETAQLAENEKELVCIVCPVGCKMKVSFDNNKINNISGNKCRRGYNYASEEFTAPRRVLTSTVHANVNGKEFFAPVKTNGAIPRELMLEAMGELAYAHISSPLEVGAVVLHDLLQTGVDVVTTDNII